MIGVHWLSALEDLEVQVRPGHPTGRSGPGNGLAGSHPLAGFDRNLRQMGVSGGHLSVVLDEDGQ
jgi:hypothetical protein